MKNLNTYAIFESQNNTYDKYIISIIQILDDKKVDYTDLVKGKNYLYMYINNHPFSWSFVESDVTVIVEFKDSTTDSLGTYDINTELDKSIDTVLSYK